MSEQSIWQRPLSRLTLLLSTLLAACVMLGWQYYEYGQRFWHQHIIHDWPQLTTVAGPFQHPWSLVFLPDGSQLVTERSGHLWWLNADDQQRQEIHGLPTITVIGQGGLLDVALDPQYTHNHYVYLSYAEAEKLDQPQINGLAVLRAYLNLATHQLEHLQVIFRQQPKVASSAHFGGRLVFAQDGSLFITLGDRQTAEQRGFAQDLSRHNGKIVRIWPDGQVPTDNPFRGNADARPEIWSYGHRNPQGATLNPQTHELWESEHGPQGGDEINIIRAGQNYGWPIVTWGCEYGSCSPIGEGKHKEGMTDPLTVWVPRSTAPSGLLFYTGRGFPEWRGQLLSGSLAGQTLWRMEIKDNRIVARHGLPLNMRIRDVRQGPDGWIYLLEDSPTGYVWRLSR